MKSFWTISILFLTQTISAQSVDQLLIQGRSLRAEYKEAEALKKFNAVLVTQPNNLEALHNASYLTGTVGNRLKDDNAKKVEFAKAQKTAEKAMKIDNNSAEAHYSYLISLGLMSEVAGSPRERLENARIIKSKADLVVKLDPKHAGAQHVLGRWHHGISDLNFFEVAATELLFGGVPEGATFEKSQKHLRKAMALRPNYILYHKDLAVTLEELDKDDEAIALLQKAIKLPAKTPDDPRYLKECRELLDDWD